MKIAIIGTGRVGQALGTGWARAGHQVIFGSRRPDSDEVQQIVAAAGPNASAAPVAEAAAAAGVVVLATPWAAVRDVIASAGDLAGKVVVDCTNPIKPGLELAVGLTTSGGEQVAGWAAGARVVKAFNTTGAENMANPDYGGRPATMFICGDDAGARATVASLASDLGFGVVDCGPLKLARTLEPLAILWIHLAAVQGLGRNIAFALLHREGEL
ncbi:MAG: NAD(P)-binding domain-containing protein [Chloroflexi bacterium]|nr:NAD(P)-binding domain-containing protein [Chloroflexota bacterium]MCI0647061.1 NAD(P)-binding domain-containing protein [Chloroflexota bacterium]MCI0731548.1 NAD(P)-binding domain-containing protein [Chloroflexota bacterium]